MKNLILVFLVLLICSTLKLFAQVPFPFASYNCQPSPPGTICFSAYDSAYSYPAPTFAWDFGDASPIDTNHSICHTYAFPASYTILITLTNIHGSAADTLHITLDASGNCVYPPVANFTYTPWVCTNDPVIFHDVSQNIPTSWLWTFPGGTPSTSTLQNPSVLYNTVGNYSVKLKVTNAYGTDSMNSSFNAYSCPPFSNIYYWCTGNPGTVTFYDSVLTSCYSCSYAWNFGDGSPIDTNLYTTHTFAIYPATYTVILTVTNPSGTVADSADIVLDSAGVCVNYIYPQPVADFSFSCLNNGMVQFTDLSTNSPTAWWWDFGDGTSSFVQNPVHLFSTFPGIFNVHFFPSNNGGTGFISKNVGIDGSGNCCSFDTVNVIMGKRFHDFNDNCTIDSLEALLPNRMMIATPGPYYSYTNQYGDYFIFINNTGNYTVAEVPYNGWGQECPVYPNGYACNFTGYGNVISDKYFGDTIAMQCPDLRISLHTWPVLRCFSTTTTINCWNFGTTTANGITVSFTADSLLTVQSAVPSWTSNTGNTYEWNIGTLASGQTAAITVQDLISCSANIGDVLTSTASIMPVAGDCSPLDNNTSDVLTVTGSYDPNDKWVKARDYATNGYVKNDLINGTDELEYVINFQNTGTGQAMFVELLDTIDSHLDVSTLEPLASSHTVTSFSVVGSNVIRWYFNNINLPDSGSNQSGSHGFVKYKIKQKSGNTTGTQILNRAGIYFDYNPVVLTNYVVNTVNTNLSVAENANKGTFIDVIPNPFCSSTTLFLSKPIQSGTLVLYDILGKEIKRMENLNGKEIIIQREGMLSGMYFYSLIDKTGLLGNGKMIVE